ncbi:MAG: hypothetical protein EPO24_07385 [Bacteroidetes bacterium]|nr:MAG: hypothetical protein EPO24_07385 [Bacteroidota bacterium]
MNTTLLRLILYILFSLSVVGALFCQQMVNEERSLSLLRGFWEYPTFEEVYTLKFLTDTKVEMNRKTRDYSIHENTLFIRDGEGETRYSFSMEGNILTLTYPDRERGSFTRKDYGEYEKQLVGAFYPSGDPSTEATCLQFFDDITFTLTEYREQNEEHSSTNVIKNKGVFRIEGNTIILVFDEGGVEHTSIRYHTSDGMIDGFLYGEQLYERELPIVQQEPEDRDVVVVVEYPPHPRPVRGGGCPRPEPHYPPIIAPVSPPVVSNPPLQVSTPPAPPDKPRDFGTTRSSTTETGSRQSEQPPQRRGGRP